MRMPKLGQVCQKLNETSEMMEIGFDEEEAVNITKIKQADVVSTLLEDNEANEEHQESHVIPDIHLDKDVDPGTVVSDVQVKSPGLPEICNDEDVSLGADAEDKSCDEEDQFFDTEEDWLIDTEDKSCAEVL